MDSVPVLLLESRHWLCPPYCAGCGFAYPFHPWCCPVSIRLCAQLIAPVGNRWRNWAHSLAGGYDPVSRPARHWRRVAAEPQPGVSEHATPLIACAEWGLEECQDGSAPGSGELVQELMPVLESVFPGVCPVPSCLASIDIPVSVLPESPGDDFPFESEPLPESDREL